MIPKELFRIITVTVDGKNGIKQNMWKKINIDRP